MNQPVTATHHQWRCDTCGDDTSWLVQVMVPIFIQVIDSDYTKLETLTNAVRLAVCLECANRLPNSEVVGDLVLDG